MEETSIAASVASVILAVVAIFLAAYFFSQAKNTERDVATSLSKIETQGDALQKLTGRWMDRLTRYATEPKPADETLVMLVKTITEIPGMANKLSSTTEVLAGEAISGYIAAYYYVGIANILLQGYLAIPDYTSNAGLRMFVDSTYRDFTFLDHALIGVEASTLKGNRLYHLYTDTVESRKAFVRDAASFDASFTPQSE